MTGRRPQRNRRRPEWVQQLEERRLLANLGDLGIYLVDHATRQRVSNPYAGEQVEIHASFVAQGVTPGAVVRLQRETANGVLYTEMAAPESWAGYYAVDRNLFTWTVPPANAWVKVTLDPQGTVTETNEGDNSYTLTVTPGEATGVPEVPAYHSLPGAGYALYLDFDGNYQERFVGSTDVTTPAYDSDGDPLVLSDGEREEVRQIWARVAEDYAPFDIDVTTELPQDGQYEKWQRVAIGGASCDWYQFSAAGTAMVGSFTWTGAASAAFVFVEQANGDGSANRYSIATIADAASHEAGHTFGLNHQAKYDAVGNLVSEYNDGDGTWGPIMGKSGNEISTWYNGPTDEGATAYQDDMAVIAGDSNGFGYRADDVGDDVLTAKALGTFAGTLSAEGVIGKNDDVDVYSAELPGGQYTIAVDVAADGPNLDAVLDVIDSSGTLMTSSSPADRQSASVDLTVAAGMYYMAVHGTGAYGWIGQYDLSVREQGPVEQPGPTPPPVEGPAVDLAAVWVGKTPKSVKAGVKSAMQVLVKNVGELASAGAVTVKVYASPTRELTGDEVKIGQLVVKQGIESGKRAVVRVPVVYAKGMKGGDYFIVAAVEGKGGESSTENNVIVGAAVKVIAPAAKLTGKVSPNRTVLSGEAWTAQVVVRNEGNAAYKGKAEVKVYASADGVLGDKDDVLLGTASVSMTLGARASKKVGVGAGPVGTAGKYYLFAVVTWGDGATAIARKAVRVRFA